jgi:hypothetical protein
MHEAILTARIRSAIGGDGDIEKTASMTDQVAVGRITDRLIDGAAMEKVAEAPERDMQDHQGYFDRVGLQERDLWKLINYTPRTNIDGGSGGGSTPQRD